MVFVNHYFLFVFCLPEFTSKQSVIFLRKCNFNQSKLDQMGGGNKLIQFENLNTVYGLAFDSCCFAQNVETHRFNTHTYIHTKCA